MSLKLSEVKTREEFADVARATDEVWSNPESALWKVMRGPNLEGWVERTWNYYQENKPRRWVKVVDETTGEIVGGAEFVFNETNPFAQALKPIDAQWWPEGSAIRDIGNQMLNSFYQSRPARMSRAHLLISLLFVREKYRRRGAASMLLRWGIDIADDLGLESFVESSPMAQPVYELFGFVRVGHIVIDAIKEQPGQEWQETYAKLLPSPDAPPVLWRPKGGKFEAGITKYSWEE